eukprot:5106291-Prymnesium_polylepis.1
MRRPLSPLSLVVGRSGMLPCLGTATTDANTHWITASTVATKRSNSSLFSSSLCWQDQGTPSQQERTHGRGGAHCT